MSKASLCIFEIPLQDTKRIYSPTVKILVRKLNRFIKAIILWLRPGILFGFLSAPLFFMANVLRLTRWISQQNKHTSFNDFFVASRDHSRRYKLFDHVVSNQSLAHTPIDYLEFGVSGGHSFRWWSAANRHPDSRFYGFDTFHGLPEDWGTYSKGDMAAKVPELSDPRCEFIKGLFQDTLFPFVDAHPLREKRKVIHLDADLFSSTLFVLTTLGRDLREGDIILFDEFNVPDHEWLAYDMFIKSFYLKTKLLGAVNNYYQVAFIIAGK